MESVQNNSHDPSDFKNPPRLYQSKSIPLIIGILILITFIIYFLLPVQAVDIFWQMAYGKYFLANKTLIANHTVFTWTPSDGRLIYCAWLSETLLYLLFKIGGWTVLYGLRYLCLFVFVLLFFRFAYRHHVLKHPLVGLACLLGILMSKGASYIKPELFSYVYMAFLVWLWFGIKASTRTRNRHFYFIPFIFLLWVNSHGGYIFGLMFLAALVLGETANVIFASPHRLSRQSQKHLFIAVVLSGLVIFITPYGLKYPFQLFDYLFLGGFKSNEYQMVNAYKSIFDPLSLTYHYVDYFVLALIVFGIALWPMLKQKRIDWTVIVPNIMFGYIYTRYLRTTYFWAILFPFTCLYLVIKYPEVLNALSAKARKTIQVTVLLICMMIAGRAQFESVCKLYDTIWFGFGIGYLNPVDESQFIKTHLSGLRLGNDYDTGGYLMWDLYPQSKIFIDPRYFPFRDWFSEYHRFIFGQNNGFINKYPCDVWCLKLEYPVVKTFLNSMDWKLVYYGPVACIFVRKGIVPDSWQTQKALSLFHIKSLPQAYKAVKFALSIKDTDTAQKIVATAKSCLICPDHRKLLSKMNSLLGVYYLKNSNLDKSKNYFETALTLNDTDPALFSSLALIDQRHKNFNKAIVNYNKALAIQEDYLPALNNLAGIYAISGQFDVSVRIYQKLLKYYPSKTSAYYNLACVYAKQNNVEECMEWLKKAFEKGYRNWKQLKNDPDLKNVQADPRFQKLIAEYSF